MTDVQPDEARAEAPAVGPLLETIRSPEDLKRLPAEKLPQVCDELRAFLLRSVQETGGHLGSNLGVVELSVALHRVFDFRRDRLVWDVSHQAYPHKVLTGRRERFESLRQTGGLCGFTHPEESPYDLFHTGHAGTSISLGLGMATASAHDPTRPHVVSVIGDASLGAGVAFEALNHAGASGERMIVVLNDNEWSISKTVGALARYLTRIRSARVVQRAQQEIHGLLQSIPLIGDKVEGTIAQIREVLRHSIVQGHVFEELGVTYVGPVNGHDVDYLVENLERVRQLEGVVLLHTLTQKGKGHPDAPTHPERVHAAKPPVAKVEAAAQAPPPEKGPSFTQAFADSLEELAEKDLRVHAITAAMPSGTGMVGFSERFPTRFHDVGICEQHGVALAAGMAKSGLRPVVAIYSTFLQRGYDQVFQEVILQGLPVTFCMDRAGLVGQDGPTHNGVFDIAYLRTIPGVVLCAPRDATDMARMLEAAVDHGGPVAVRYPRDNCPVRERIPPEERREMEPGKAEVLIEGSEGGVCLWGYGAILKQVLQAAERLARRGVQVGVIDARYAKPIDEELLARCAQRYRHVLTVEEHQRMGGFGSAALEAWSRLPDRSSRLRILGVPDRFCEHRTSREEQLAAIGLDAAGIERAVAQLPSVELV
ncbi:MAG: 1-deoxy-D-xylulose-5-phosphate synthase [Planctomycetota bacterium]